MIRTLTATLVLMSSVAVPSAMALDLEYVRKNYEQAASNKKLCRTLIDGLAGNMASNVHLAYLGALRTIWAKHVSSPTAKLKTFSEGKHDLESAVKADANNVEIRFLRFSVQQNAPSFLDYNDDIKTDRAFIMKYKHTVSSATLLQLIDKALK